MVQKIKVYSERSYCADDGRHLPMLVPFWGMWNQTQYWEEVHYTGLDAEKQLDNYMAVVKDYFDLVHSMEEADVVLLPTKLMTYFTTGREHLVYQMAREAAEAQKRILIFNNSDYHLPIDIDNAIILSSSLYRSRQKPNEFGGTSWIPDYFEGTSDIREKGDKPVVGFCGQVNEPSAFERYVKHVARRLLQDVRMRHIGSLAIKRWDNFEHKYLRYDGLTHLQDSPMVETDFIFRQSYYGNAVDVKNRKWEQEAVQTVRREYLNNILNTDYTFCARGNGNFSFRFYEILSAGRIPLFIDTDSVLPYDFVVDWEKQFFWLDVRNLSQVGPRLYDYHCSLTPEQFQDIQQNCRYLWEEWLSPRGFYKNFYRHLDLAYA